MQSPDRFGALLRRHRIAAGLSQEDLARKARVSAESIGALERGARLAPYRATVEQLASALKLSDDEGEAFEAAAARARVRSARAASPKNAEPHHKLPLEITSFVGRDDDVAEVLALLAKSRLVTITGSGGVGKTRVALEAARRRLTERTGEVWFADLASLRDGSLIAGNIAFALRLPAAGFESVGALAGALARRRGLLILDNCEHLVAAAASVAHELLQHCPDVVVLATSRERLNVSGEAVFRLPSLSLPARAPLGIRQARSYASVELFVERAEAAGAPSALFSDDNAAAVADVCRRLDGIPLALELAAASVPALGIADLRARLVQSLSTFGPRRDMPQRQQTMLATIAWSYDLLSDAEAQLLQRLSVFAGGFTLDAAEAVCAAPPLDPASVPSALSSLVDKSLVAAVHEDERTRYALLESVREFGRERLESAGMREAVSLSHARWVATLAQRFRPSGLADIENGASAAVELENVRAALEWCRVAPSLQNRGLAARIVIGMQSLWGLSGRNAELVNLGRAALENIDDEAQALDAALILGLIIARIWEPAECRAAIERARPIYERLGHRQALVQFWSMLAATYARLDDLPESERASERALRIIAEDGLEGTLLHTDVLASRALLRTRQDRFDEARADLTRASATARALGVNFFVFAVCLPRLVELELHAGNFARAIEVAEEMLACSESSVRQLAITEAYGLLACLHLRLGDLDRAEAASRAQLEFAPADNVLAIEYLATIAALRGRVREAARLQGFVRALLRVRPNLAFDYQRVDDILSASLSARLSDGEIAAERALGAAYTVARATSVGLSAARGEG